MEDFFTVSVNSDPKHGLGLLASDLETFQFPTLCTGKPTHTTRGEHFLTGPELDNEQLLALDDPQSFYLAFPDAGVFGHCDEALSRTSSAVTPQSECSTRTTLSAQNVSPTSDISPFQDKPSAQDIEAMYHDTTQSIISGRSSRATSVTWSTMNNSQAALNSTLTQPVRTTSHRPQSFSYRTPQITQSDAITPPPPSSFFPSPNLQAQAVSSRSPYLSSNAHSPLMPQMSQLSAQNAYIQPSLSPNSSSYYGQAQSQPQPPQVLQQAFQQSSNPAFLAQLQQQQHLQQHASSLQQPQSQHRPMQNNLHAQSQLGTAMFPYPPLSSQSNSQSSFYNPNSNNHPSTNLTTPPTLPNTTGNSSTGYQCFSHGCGGRHFSNWGNLVRHHRERQLRSKAGAKPTCPRCGKGFTRSSARDAHVAGLKCVLGRRRRGGAGVNGATSTNTSGNSNGTSADAGKVNANSNLREADGEADELQYYAGQRIKGEGLDEALHDNDHDHDHDNDNDNGSEGSREDGGEDEDDMDLLDGDKRMGNNHDRDAVADMLGFSGDAGQAYLAPEQLHFTL